MSSMTDKGVLSHGEELERNDMNTAPGYYMQGNPALPCPWKSYENCRNCGLYGTCYTLEA
jgi:hypothetical protein